MADVFDMVSTGLQSDVRARFDAFDALSMSRSNPLLLQASPQIPAMDFEKMAREVQSFAGFNMEKKVRNAATLAATYDMPLSTALGLHDAFVEKLHEPNLWDKAVGSFKAGWGDVYCTIGGILKRTGIDPEGAERYLYWGEQLRRAYIPPSDQSEFSWRKLLDPEWHATTVMRSVPSGIALIPAAVVGAYGGAALGAAGATAAGASALGAKTVGVIAGAAGGAAVSRPLESAMEAQGAYDEAKQKGFTDEAAERAADQVFWDNMKLTGMDAAEFAAAFLPMGKLPGRITKRIMAQRILAATGKVTSVGLMEAAEERYQEKAVMKALGDPVSFFDFSNPRLNEASAAGAVFGMGLGGAGSVWTALTNRITADMPKGSKQVYERARTEALTNGAETQAAELAGLDAVASTPEGKAHIETVVTDLKDLVEGKPALFEEYNASKAPAEQYNAGLSGEGKPDVRSPSSEAAAVSSPVVRFEGDTVDKQGNIRVSAERRQETIERAFQEKETAEQRGEPLEVVLTGGPPGGGKSTSLEAAGIDKSEFVRADADNVKEWLGYGDQAPAIHAESSAINKEIANRALKEGYHLVYESLLSNFNVADSIIRRTLDKGGVVTIFFNDIDAITSQVRSKLRVTGGKTNRIIPPEASVEAYNSSLPTFLELWKRYEDNPDVDFVLRDNNVDAREPVTVFTKRDGELRIMDRHLFDKYMATEYIEVGGKYERERNQKATAQEIEGASQTINERVRRQAPEGSFGSEEVTGPQSKTPSFKTIVHQHGGIDPRERKAAGYLPEELPPGMRKEGRLGLHELDRKNTTESTAKETPQEGRQAAETTLNGRTFILSPEGSIDFGVVPDEIGAASNGRFPGAPIRVEKGEGGEYGYLHIKDKRIQEIKEAGYADELDMLHDVARNFTDVYEQPNGRLLLVKKNGRKKYAVVELQRVGDGYYGVTTWFLGHKRPTGRPYEETGGKEPLLHVARATDPGKSVPFITPGIDDRTEGD